MKGEVKGVGNKERKAADIVLYFFTSQGLKWGEVGNTEEGGNVGSRGFWWEEGIFNFALSARITSPTRQLRTQSSFNYKNFSSPLRLLWRCVCLTLSNIYIRYLAFFLNHNNYNSGRIIIAGLIINLNNINISTAWIHHRSDGNFSTRHQQCQSVTKLSRKINKIR
jgi:hypothetical protein